MPNTDILIIGSGIAGLCTAIKLAEVRPDLRVAILTKVKKKYTGTQPGADGIAVVWDHARDSYAKHSEDTLRAGKGYCDPEVVSLVVREGQQRVKELIEWGVRFDQTPDRQYDLGMAEGHSEPRMLRYRDRTEHEIQRALSAKAATYDNIDFFEHHVARELFTLSHLTARLSGPSPNKQCLGAYVLDQKSSKGAEFFARITVLATVGTGQPPSLTIAEEIAMVQRAGGQIKNAGFVPSHTNDSDELTRHFLKGGIEVDLNGLTTIDCLYAVGECAYTGFHGAGRLPGNNPLEAIVFAHRIARSVADMIDDIDLPEG